VKKVVWLHPRAKLFVNNILIKSNKSNLRGLDENCFSFQELLGLILMYPNTEKLQSAEMRHVRIF
jgi:hypothetical protein